MVKHLRQVLARYWKRWWPRGGWVRAVLGNEKIGSADARTRFWAELREGQREAEAECSKSHRGE
jgi:hypothetical protein